MEDPELITLISDEEIEKQPQLDPSPTAAELSKRLLGQIVLIACLKVATGFAVRGLAKTIRDFDVLYPEHLSRIQWKDYQ